jgi:hypothetical protein
MRSRTLLLAAGLVVAALIASAAGYALSGGAESAATGEAGTKTVPTSTISDPVPPSTTTPPPPSPSPSATAPKPAITRDLIAYGARRRAQMAGYALRHYGRRSFVLHPHLIVLHFTASGAGSYPGVHALFGSDARNMGELPGVCAHFVVDQDGTIYQQAPLRIMCRHAIGVNDRAIGIEMIQSPGTSSHWADQQILHRRPQIRSVLHLVRWLRARYEIAMKNVIGHAMVNDSHFFHDREGWRNDHTDWQRQDVRELRRRL